MTDQKTDAPACLHCVAVAAAAKAERAAAKASTTAADAADAAKAAKATRPRLWTFERAYIVAAAAALCVVFFGNVDDPPRVHYVAEIVWADGGVFRHAFATESACVEYTRTMGASVASANCYTETQEKDHG